MANHTVHATPAEVASDPRLPLEADQEVTVTIDSDQPVVSKRTEEIDK